MKKKCEDGLRVHSWAVLSRCRDGDLMGCDECGKTRFMPSSIAPMGAWDVALIVALLVVIGGLIAWAIL